MTDFKQVTMLIRKMLIFSALDTIVSIVNANYKFSELNFIFMATLVAAQLDA